jgi:L-phenylalanine/L-methionine N-acetyltransferase
VSRPPGGGPEPDAPPPDGVEIRPARPADARQSRRLFAEVAAEGRYIRTEDVRWSVREMRKRYRESWTTQSASIVAVAVADGRLIGTLGVGRETHPVTRHVASLGMMVAEDWRARGVGSALLAEAFRWARWAGVEKLALTVYPDNDRARRLYERFGFTEEGRLVGHSRKRRGYEDEIVMGRWM